MNSVIAISPMDMELIFAPLVPPYVLSYEAADRVYRLYHRESPRQPDKASCELAEMDICFETRPFALEREAIDFVIEDITQRDALMQYVPKGRVS